MTTDRQIRTDAQGLPVLSYVKGVKDGLPWADDLEFIGPDPVGLIMSQLRGWAVSAPMEVSEQLMARGARLLRHAHVMSCDLTSGPFDAVEAPDGFRFVPCDRTPEQVFRAWQAAYPPGHPDHQGSSDSEALDRELAPLLDGRLLGDVLPCSVLAVDVNDLVVAGVVVNDWDGHPPWISEVFRHPVDAPPGMGSLLLRRAQARAAADGLSAMCLVVTHGNPAQRIYERLGFVVFQTVMTVAI